MSRPKRKKSIPLIVLGLLIAMSPLLFRFLLFPSVNVPAYWYLLFFLGIVIGSRVIAKGLYKVERRSQPADRP